MHRRRAGLLLFALSALFVIRATLTPQADIVGLLPRFWCVACSAQGGSDATLNIALFLPLGIALGLLRCSWLRALAIGAVLSALIESSQHMGWPAGRVANVTDVLANAIGTTIGAGLVVYWRAWLQPTASRAIRLLLGGTITACALLMLTAWALGRDVSDGVHEQVAPRRRPSRTGYGWYHGRVLSGGIGAVQVEKQMENSYGGPLIFDGELAAVDTVRVRVVGRDERAEFVPALYLRRSLYEEPLLMLGQEGVDARLLVKVRARRLHLAMPQLFLRDTVAWRDSLPLELRAIVGPGTYVLERRQGDRLSSATLHLTLGLGWTLFQTVVHVEDRGAQLLSIAWLVILCAPLGFWLVHVRQARAVWWAVVITLMVATGIGAPVLWSISPTPLSEWLSMGIGLLLGASAARISGRRESAAALD